MTMAGSILVLVVQCFLILATNHITLTTASDSADHEDNSCARVAALDEALAETMRVQLLQTNDVPATPKQIRLQAQEKRNKLITEEAQKWNALKREHKMAVAAEHLAEIKDRELIREAQEQAAAKEDMKSDSVDAEEEEKDSVDDVPEQALNASSTVHRPQVAVAKRMQDKHKVLQMQADKRNRALKKRGMRKQKSSLMSPMRRPGTEKEHEEEAADKVLAMRDAAMKSAAEVMAAQGVTPETIQAAEDLLSHRKISLLEAPHNVSGHPNVRGQLARQMLSEQEEQRAFARKIRMAASGADLRKEAAEQQRKLEEEKSREQEKEKQKAEAAARKKNVLPTPAELRSQAMHAKLKEQQAMRSSASEIRLENLAKKHTKKKKKTEDSTPVPDFAIKPASLDVKMSPAARRNQVRRLAQAHKKAIADSVHEKK